VLTGRLLAESLRIGVDLSVPDLRVVRLGRHDVAAGATDAQPPVWTFLDFEAPDERADELADALTAALDTRTGWYADFSVGDDHVVVFASRVFRYRIGDRRAREEAVAWGRAAGTPEHQLDWGD